MSDLPDRISSLSPEKRILLAKRLSNLSSQVKLPNESIPRREAGGVVPLSLGQERLWFLDRLTPDSAVYNVPAAVRLRGLVAVGALADSLSDLVRRHEALRTTFPLIDGQARQQIGPPYRVILPLIDLQAWPAAHRLAAARQLATVVASQPFDLEVGPLLRTGLVQLGPAEHLLVLLIHHIVFDGWSLNILIQELLSLYAAKTCGQAPQLPELPIQYADYALWQRQRLQGERLASQLAYWQQHLAGAAAGVELPTDRPRPAVQTFQGGLLAFAVPPATAQALQALSQEYGATLFMVLLAGFQALLYRYTGQTDLLLGTPVAGRERPEVEGVIGFFVNTLMLRTDVSGNPTFGELVRRVRQVALEAYARAEVPFEKVVEVLRPERDLSRSPLFQIMFAMQNDRRPVWHLPGLEIEPLGVEGGASKFDLTLFMEETAAGGGLVGWLEYNADLFERSTMERLAGHYGTLLGSVTPEVRLAQLDLLEAAERQWLLGEGSGPVVEYVGGAGPAEWLDTQAQQQPDRVAVVSGESHLTYQELSRRSRQVGQALRREGVGPERVVALYLERSLEMVIGLLGVLQAGAAYLPLDPEYPAERLAYMFADSQASVLLTQAALAERLPASEPSGGGRKVLYLDRDWPLMAREPDGPLARSVCAENLAYVIYTSGSTGRPKGAMNSLGALRNRLLWMQAAYQLDECDSVLQKTPFSFDVSVWEFFWPLLSGARLVMARPGGHRDSAYLVQLMAEQSVTTVHFVPSMLQAFIDEPGLGACSSLRRVLCSGEALPTDLWTRCLERLSTIEVHNLYGPTEAAVDVTSWWGGSSGPTVPIGRPIANLRIHLLDEQGNLVPLGVPGELYIGGLGLGRGYWARPELTAEKFVPDRLGLAPGSRLYRTGDLARWRGEGVLEFLGRLDDQVKLRGYRIELGEIEVQLREHPAVREAVVLLRADPPGEGRLVAYWVASVGSEVAEEDLRRWLQARLPDYMLPSAFVGLAALPLLPNGKLDRRQLPAPLAGVEVAYQAPRTAVEAVLAGIWARVLGVEQVGIQDDFFRLGGHSLKAIQMINSIDDEFKIRLTVKDLFFNPTIARMADQVQHSREILLEKNIPLKSQTIQSPHALSYAQRRLWFIDQLIEQDVSYVIPLGAQIQGEINQVAFNQAWEQIYLRHSCLRAVFVEQDGSPIAIVNDGINGLPLVCDLMVTDRETAWQLSNALIAEDQRPL